MKLTTILLLAACLQLSARGVSQSVTFTGTDVAIGKVLREVTRQTNYHFFYRRSLLNESTPVSIRAVNQPLEAFLRELLKNQPLEYSIENKNIILSRKRIIPGGTSFTDTLIRAPVFTGSIAGVVVDASGKALSGASIATKSGGAVVITNARGFFRLQANAGDVLIVSFVGFQTRQITLTQKSFSGTMTVVLVLSNSPLDDVQIIAYGTTSRRLNTSGSTTVKGEDLNKAPVVNPLAALEGRAPGVLITQSSGVPGAAFKVLIRGRTKVDDNGADEEPLYIVDGVPMATGNSNMNQIGSAISANATSGLSPFATINMAEIESIDILKDADATAIYGSRGASGVILITTKKAKAGAMHFDFKGATGGSRAKLPDLLSTKEYVMLRKEAFKNDKITMNNTNAYDLLLWDTTRDNNFAKQLIGGTASFTTAEGSLSGGTQQTQYLVGGGYYRETDVYPGTMPNSRASGHISLTSKSADQKFSFGFTGNYTATHNQTASQDMAFYLTLPPNMLLYDSVGNLAWNEKGIQKDNPLAGLKKKYDVKITNLNANVQLGYKITPELTVRSSIGYNIVHVAELEVYPKTSLNPNNFLPGAPAGTTTTGTTYFGDNNFKSWIVEPQLEYNKSLGRLGKINVLAGATMQDQRNNGYKFQVTNYTSDDFLGTLIGVTSASIINPSSNDNEYK
ncbi:MAG: TonB-dependent receptor plug domain-containing protein, partial [Bacteroidetes bacterium]|nr:TonB-dependent receptor plug domain-containing protein [Bacteroidota bacterium]